MCPFVSKYSGNLLKHKRSVHVNLRAFRCERCSYVAKTSFLLKRHIRSKHKEDPLALLKEKNDPYLEVNGGSKESNPVAENFIDLLNKNTAIADYNRATGENIPLMPLPKEIDN